MNGLFYKLHNLGIRLVQIDSDKQSLHCLALSVHNKVRYSNNVSHHCKEILAQDIKSFIRVSRENDNSGPAAIIFKGGFLINSVSLIPISCASPLSHGYLLDHARAGVCFPAARDRGPPVGE